MMEDAILMRTLNGEQTERPPFWFMRQAGRVLPSYMQLKQKHSFWEMMKDPELGADVTLLPINDLGVDAAILFSDILVIPYAMGMGLEFTDAGPKFDTPLTDVDDPISKLKPDPSKLQYIYNVIDQVIKKRPANIPLIGFCGGPLTVLCYMLEGIGRREHFPNTIKFIYQRKKETISLVKLIQELSLIYMEEQVKHGVNVFQLFETHAGLIPFTLYEELFMPMVKAMANKARELKVPFIYFPKGAGTGISKITPDICDFLGVDWHTPLSVARELVDDGIGLQGNLDPRVLYGSKTEIETTLNSYKKFGKAHQNWIFNLGHGFLPDIPYENAKFLAEWLKYTDWNRS